jgi:hypothetical protein
MDEVLAPMGDVPSGAGGISFEDGRGCVRLRNSRGCRVGKVAFYIDVSALRSTLQALKPKGTNTVGGLIK